MGSGIGPNSKIGVEYDAPSDYQTRCGRMAASVLEGGVGLYRGRVRRDAFRHSVQSGGLERRSPLAE